MRKARFEISSWIPECCTVLNRHKPSWADMVPLKRGESLQQILRFFNSLSRLIVLQIRWLLYSWMDEWLTIMSYYKRRDTSVIINIQWLGLFRIHRGDFEKLQL